MSQEVLIDVRVIPDVDRWKIILVTNKRTFAKIFYKQSKLLIVWCTLLEMANQFGKVLPDRATELRNEAVAPGMIGAGTTCKYCDNPVEVGDRCHYHWWNPPQS